MKQCFRDIRLSPTNKTRLAQINSIIGEYQEQGLILTLRQLYYQLVSRDIIPNKQAEYGKLSKILKEGRMSGIVDWEAIEDRLRVPSKPPSWDTPEKILEVAANGYMKPRMKGQKNYVEVWVEKDALSGVLRRVTEKYHINILVNRGYGSVTAMYDAYERFRAALKQGQKVSILYLGDFDPSGLDMIRDIRERVLEFMFNCQQCLQVASDNIFPEDSDTEEAEDLRTRLEDDYCQYKMFAAEQNGEFYFDVRRAWIYEQFEIIPIALTKEQIEEHEPPPNPAKLSDPRAGEFVQKHGDTSWEVDALRPEILNDLLETAIQERIDLKLYNKILKEEKADRAKLLKVKL